MVFTILRFSRGDFLHYCGSSVREHTQFIHQLPDPTDFPCDAVTSVRQHSKFQATITCNLDSVYCNSSVWRSLYEIHVCHSQPSDMRRVTTCCWQAETLLQWARLSSDTKIATGLRSKAVNATKPSGMKRRRSRLQRSNVCCQSVRLSESIFCLYIFIPCFELWSLVCWKYKHSTHAALRILNRDLTSWRTIKDALNHEILKFGEVNVLQTCVQIYPADLFAGYTYTENWIVSWAPTEFQPSSPTKSKHILQLFDWWRCCDKNMRTWFVWLEELRSVGGRKLHTILRADRVISQLWECQTAGVNSFPLVWGMAPCPLPHKSSGPQVFNGWSPWWSSTGAMPH